jgi:hypothetical protein
MGDFPTSEILPVYMSGKCWTDIVVIESKMPRDMQAFAINSAIAAIKTYSSWVSSDVATLLSYSTRARMSAQYGGEWICCESTNTHSLANEPYSSSRPERTYTESSDFPKTDMYLRFRIGNTMITVCRWPELRRLEATYKEQLLAAEMRAVRAERDAASARADFTQRLRSVKEESDAALATVSVAKSSMVAAREGEERVKVALREAECRAAAADKRVAAVTLRLASSDAALLAADEYTAAAGKRALIAEQNISAIRSEFEQRLRLSIAENEAAGQRRLSQCKTIGDLQHKLESACRESARHLANVKSMSAAADELRGKLTQSSIAFDAQRVEITALRLAVKTVTTALPTLSSRSIPVSTNLCLSVSSLSSVPSSVPVIDLSNVAPPATAIAAPSAGTSRPSPSPTLPNHFKSLGIDTAASKPSIPTPKLSQSRVQGTRELPSRAFPASPPALVLTSNSCASNASVSVAGSVAVQRVAAAGGTSEQPSRPFQRRDLYHVYRIASTVCLLAMNAMLLAPSVPGHVLTVSMRGAVFEPIVVNA